jgi:hypothetical protein
MTMIVGYAPDERGGAGLHLAVMLARTAGDELVVACVVPAPWAPGMARIDAEYRRALDELADRALERAKADLPAGCRPPPSGTAHARPQPVSSSSPSGTPPT